MNNEEKHGKLASFIEGLGVPANWAKVIAGATLGAVLAAAALGQTGCNANQVEQTRHFNEAFQIIFESLTYKSGK